MSSDAKPPGSPASEDPVAKLLAANAERKARRGARTRSFYNKKPGERSFSDRASGEMSFTGKSSDSVGNTDASPRANGSRRSSLTAASPSKAPAEETKELEKLREELKIAQLEIGSMRRNNVTNIQKLQAERDAFAKQLAQEQAEISPESRQGLANLQADLRATKLRNTRLEEENANLRKERKNLELRATATKTLDAASSGYEKVVVDLIEVKLKCATLNDEKEELVHQNRTQKSDNDHLSEANRLLEKSRSEWVVKCADLERQIQEAKGITTNNVGNTAATTPRKRASLLKKVDSPSPSQNSDLQELAL